VTAPDYPLLRSLPYPRDSAELFAPLAAHPWAMLLESAARMGGDYDIFVAEPVVTLVTRGGVTTICQGGRCREEPRDPLLLLREQLAEWRPAGHGLPFAGGAVGYFGYDLARRFEQLPVVAEDAEGIPEMAVGIYDRAVVVDHQARRCWLAGQQGAADDSGILAAALTSGGPAPASPPLIRRGAVRCNLDRARYLDAFHRVQAFIRAGDCYQVNLARRFSLPVRGAPWSAYRLLRRINPAPFAAWLNLPEVQVLSASPERFLQVRQGAVETRPIKGTRPRAADPEADRAAAEALLASAKDRAENVMIVDLLRNDLGRNCAVGSVTVDQLCTLERFATVHHLVSTVRGRLAPGRDALDLLRGCFPGGSITGAPKLRAMEIIESLEPHRRGVYCGSIGHIGFDGAMDTNIAIRTLVVSGGEMRFWAGGGIVADSRAEAEFQETKDKAAALLETIRRLSTG